MDDNATLQQLLDSMLAEKVGHVRSTLESQLHAARQTVQFIEALLSDESALRALVPVEATVHKAAKQRRRRRKARSHATTN